MKPEIVPELRPFVEKAEAAYERFYKDRLQETLERTAFGKYVAMHMDTGEYVLADTDEEAMHQFKARSPEAIPLMIRVGMPTLIA